MQIGGFMKQSFIDFPGEISAVIFTQGCNLNCWYCHNRSLIPYNHEKLAYSLEHIYKFLESRKDFIDGVVISGGEPTEQSDIEEVVLTLKKMGFKVKLDTNGTNPNVLAKLLPNLNYVAMDIKNSLQNYGKTVCKSVDIEKIKQSIDILINGSCDYEFRTTFSTDITLEDIEEIAKTIKNAKRYIIQTYNPQTENAPKQPYENYGKAQEIAKKYIINTLLR